MKAVVIILAIVVAVSGNPINRKWEEIGDLVQGIRGNVGRAIAEIKEIGNAANPEVGQQISTYLDGKTPQALAILEKVNVHIEAQTLTYQQAEEYFTQLETLLNKVKDDLRNFVSKLPQEAQVTIKNVLNNYTDAIRQKKEKIFVLLSLKQFTASVQKWEQISDLVKGIRGHVGNTIADIKKIATAANPQVGQEISTYLDGKTPEALTILEKVNAEIQAQSLTYQQAEKYFNQLETLLNKVKDELRNFVSQLPQNAQVDIKNVLDENIKSIREKKNQIFTLLSLKRSANTPEKWNEIRNLVKEIRANVGNTIAGIKKTATEANQEIGQQITKYLDGKTPEALAILEKINAEIDAQTLTYSQADVYFTQLETLLNKVKDDLRNFVTELPQATQMKIKTILEDSTKFIKEKADKIFTILTLRY